MNGKQYVGRKLGRFESYGPVRAVSGIALAVDADNEYRAGDQTGYVMRIDCPYGSQAMAEDLLAALGGKSYTAYGAENAVMDPEAELGDGVTVGGIYSLLASREMAFGAGHAQIGAPGDSDLDREYGVESFQEQIQRKLAAARSYIEKTAEQIRLGVEGLEGRVSELSIGVEGITGTVKGLEEEVSEIAQTAGSITLSVSGALGGKASIELSNGSKADLDLSHVRSAFANDASAVTISGGTVTFNSNTFVVNSTNFSVTSSGTITAKAGVIGNSASDGWNIGSRSIYNGTNSMTSTVQGTYIGTDGIRQYAGGDRFVSIANGVLSADQARLTYAYLEGSGIKHDNGPSDVAAMISGNVYLAREYPSASYTFYGIAGGDEYGGGDTVTLLYASTNYNDDQLSAVLGYKCATRINGTVISLEHGPTYGSDRDIKKDIAPLPEKYLRLLEEMRPVIYRYRDQPDDGPVHTGYIAQEMEQAIARAGLTRADVAALVGRDGTGQMGIGYDELIPILHLWMTRLEQRVQRLEAR